MKGTKPNFDGGRYSCSRKQASPSRSTGSWGDRKYYSCSRTIFRKDAPKDEETRFTRRFFLNKHGGGYLPEVRSQDDCSSCWCFTSTAADKKDPVDLSHQMLVDDFRHTSKQREDPDEKGCMPGGGAACNKGIYETDSTSIVQNFVNILHRCVVENNISVGDQIHNQIVKRGLESSPAIKMHLVDFLINSGHVMKT